MENPQNENTKQSKPANPVKFNSLEEEVQYYKDKLNKCLKLINYQETQIKNTQTKLKQFEIDEGKKYELLFKLNYEQVTFFFFKTDNSYHFFHEKVLDEEFKKILISNSSIKTWDYENDMLKKDETMVMMQKQYEDRIIRMTNELQKSEDKFFQTNKNYKNSMKEIETYQKAYEDLRTSWESQIKEIIQQSYEITNKLKNLGEIDFSDKSVRDQVLKEIKENIKNFLESNDYPYLDELKSNINDTFIAFLENINKKTDLEFNQEEQKEKFKMTLDETLRMHEEELNKKNKDIEICKKAISDLKIKIGEVENSKYSMLREKEFQIEILNKEINKGVNLNFLKNIVFSYITSDDESICEKLLPVIYMTLQFNDLEMKKVSEFRSNKKSLFNKVFSFK